MTSDGTKAIPSVSIATARTGASSKINALGMRPMQERAYAKRGEQYLLIKSPPASGKSRALMYIALDKLEYKNDLNAWVGALIRPPAKYPTFDFTIAHIGHAVAPWSAFVPVALGRMFMAPRASAEREQSEGEVRAALLLSVSIALGIQCENERKCLGPNGPGTQVQCEGGGNLPPAPGPDGGDHFVGAQRILGGDVATGPPDFVRADCLRQGCFAIHPDVDDTHTGARLTGEHVDGRTAGVDIGDHLGGHLGRKRGHPRAGNTVVAREDDHPRPRELFRWAEPLTGGHPDRQLLEAAQRTLRLGQNVLAPPGRGTRPGVGWRDRGKIRQLRHVGASVFIGCFSQTGNPATTRTTRSQCCASR